MRPVKYQAWHKIEKHMFEVVGLEWSAATDQKFRKMTLLSMDGNYTIRAVSGEETIENNYELREFIGITDRYNKDIFEGDICHLRLGHDLLEVRWSVFGFRFFNLTRQDWQMIWAADLKRLEVVGNVYEHDVQTIEERIASTR